MAAAKTAGPIRRGFGYQDLVALKLALELYIQNRTFEMYLEYGKPGGLDDIVLVSSDEVHAYQVKHAENPLDAYVFEDFAQRRKNGKRVCFDAFSKSWLDLREGYPDTRVVCHLFSNRPLDTSFKGIVEKSGCLTDAFVEAKVRKERKTFRDSLMQICELDAQTFKEFLRSFRFDLNQRDFDELEDHIIGSLLDHRLGISDRNVFLELKSQISRHASESNEPISSGDFHRLLRAVESKYLLPQQFDIDPSSLVRVETFWTKLDQQLADADGEYVVVTGLPGSGKSTSLTAYLDAIDDDDRYVCVRYYCFVNINDNKQRQRLEAQSLRVNILSELQKRFSIVLDRRFDFGEKNFHEVLRRLGEHFEAKSKKLIILLDGLDHAERETDLLEDVLTALPRQIPRGVLFLIGTQELHHWKPFALKEGRESRHIEMPLFGFKETAAFFAAYGTELTENQLRLVQDKSEGLPLYLVYIAQGLQELGKQFDLENHPVAKNGIIRSYYESLWERFENLGMSRAKYLCEVAACLEFAVHVDEFIYFQNELGLPDFDEAFRTIRHLLRMKDGMMSLFHDSFRHFARCQMSATVRQRVVAKIHERLTREMRSDRWYKHGLKYAFYVEDYAHILTVVSRQFIDDALIALRPDEEIMETIDWAVESAKASNDLVAIARLGSLHFRTYERLQNLDRASLGMALLGLGRKDDVLGFAFAWKNNRWLVSQDVALELIIWCAEVGNRELGQRLFEKFLEASWDDSDFQHDSRAERHYVTQMAKCLAIYERHRAQHLRWLSGFEFRRDPVLWDVTDHYAPFYAPHLEAYIESAIRFRKEVFWRRIIRTGKIFESKAVRYFAIRALARCELNDRLADEITAYLERYADTKNLELAAYAAQAGLPASVVSSISGVLSLPRTTPPEPETRENCVMSLREPFLTAVAAAYQGEAGTLQEMQVKHQDGGSFWMRLVSFSVLAGSLLGRVRRGDTEDIANAACEVVGSLQAADVAEGRRVSDSLDGIRVILPDILYDMTLLVVCHDKEHAEEWGKALLSLRRSGIWQTHYGWNERITDYGFEFPIWEKLVTLPMFRRYLAPIIESCEEDYLSATSIKGGSRCYHLFKLATIGAQCGLRPLAERYIQTGVEATNIYGYRKDTTLSLLITVMDLLNRRRPRRTLSRCSAILEMAKWMDHVTDGRMTQGFLIEVFPLVLRTNRIVALSLLKHSFENCPRWIALDCLEKYIFSSQQVDPEYLWALCALFPFYSDGSGRRPPQVIQAWQHVATSGETLCQGSGEWRNRLALSIRTHVTPRYWPADIRDQYGFVPDPEEQGSPEAARGPSMLLLDGVKRPIEEIKAECAKSLHAFQKVLARLRAENEHFWEYDLIGEALSRLISAAQTPEELIPIKEYAKEHGIGIAQEVVRTLAVKFVEFGDMDGACEAYELAISKDWHARTAREDLETIGCHSQTRLKAVVMQKCYDDLKTSYGGFEIPAFVATALDVLGDIEGLEQVYSDYLVHCQELLAHLPDRPMYAWLTDDIVTDTDEHLEMCSLLLSELDTDEIDLGERLVKAIVALALRRSDIVWPIICSYLQTATGLRKTRVLSVIQSIGHTEPALIRKDWRTIWKSANVSDLRQKLLAIELLDTVFADEKMPQSLRSSIDRATRKLSSTIYVSTYRLLHVNPSGEFVGFAKKATLVDFYRQLEAVADVLHLDHTHILSDLERRLRHSGWTLSVAEKERREDWEYRVHPQGWPVVWAIPRFHVCICDLLGEVLGEYAEKMKLKEWQREAVWRIIQPSDPEYLTYSVLPQPTEIPFLSVEDETDWFKELSTRNSLRKCWLPKEEWITVFESYKRSQDTAYKRPFIAHSVMDACFVDPALTTEYSQVQAHAEWRDELLFCHPHESMTWEQARSILKRPRGDLSEFSSLPAVAVKENPVLFSGFQYIASLPSWLIGDLQLEFRGCSLFKGETEVGRFECWQGGYIDEVYSRELLAEGTRVLVRVEFLEKVLDSLGMRLCRRVRESREHYESMHDREPDQKASATTVEVFSPTSAT